MTALLLLAEFLAKQTGRIVQNDIKSNILTRQSRYASESGGVYRFKNF
jgi:hypothetical protein